MHEKIRDAIKVIEKKIKGLEDEKEQLVKECVNSCDHPLEALRELDYRESSGRPWLICSGCGYTEEGWGCGYDRLRHGEWANCPKIEFSEWLGMRTVMKHQERDLG